MCLTQDGLGLSHAEQAERLCAAGARWIQLRMKGANPSQWRAQAQASVAACRRHGAVLIVNDSVEVAVASGADGVHLGAADPDWRGARERLGPAGIIGGTVNDRAGARRAAAAGCLDYAGVGPLRFTRTKERLAPVLGLEGVRRLVALLGDLPAWVIGGVEPADLADLRAAGAAGAAVASGLHRDGRIAGNLHLYLEAWSRAAGPAVPAPS
jgi:thiamine-phosphate pyrophosphorylase